MALASSAWMFLSFDKSHWQSMLAFSHCWHLVAFNLDVQIQLVVLYSHLLQVWDFWVSQQWELVHSLRLGHWLQIWLLVFDSQVRFSLFDNSNLFFNLYVIMSLLLIFFGLLWWLSVFSLIFISVVLFPSIFETCFITSLLVALISVFWYFIWNARALIVSTSDSAIPRGAGNLKRCWSRFSSLSSFCGFNTLDKQGRS